MKTEFFKKNTIHGKKKCIHICNKCENIFGLKINSEKKI